MFTLYNVRYCTLVKCHIVGNHMSRLKYIQFAYVILTLLSSNYITLGEHTFQSVSRAKLTKM